MSRRGVHLDGAAVRTLRNELNLTQQDAAELAGITTRTYQSAESGQRVSAQSAKSICVALGCSFAAVQRIGPERVQERLAAAGYGPLPPPTPWGDREEETRTVLEHLERADRKGVVCCLTGQSGIGKTGLARHVVNALTPHFPDGVVWVTASRNETDINAVATMVSIARALGFAFRLPDPLTVSTETFHQTFRRNLWSRRRLLVLDDVASIDQGWRFIGEHNSGWSLLTTMFRSVGEELGKPLIEVGPLRDDAACRLLEAHIGPARIADEPEGLRELVELLGGIPRTLQIAGRVLRRESLTRLTDYAERLASRSRSEEEARLFVDDASFANAYLQLRDRLSEEGWRLYGDLSVFGDRPFTTSWASAMARRPSTEVRTLLSELTDLYLVQEASSRAACFSDGERWFSMDAQARRVARTITEPRRDDLFERLLSLAKDEAMRIGGFDFDESTRAFMPSLPLFQRTLDPAVEAILPSEGNRVFTSPGDVPPVDDATLSQFRTLPEILAPLRFTLRLRNLPEAGEWMSAAIAVAAHTGQRLALGRIESMLAHWWSINGVYMNGHRFNYHAKDLLIEQGELEEGFSAWFYGACGVLTSQGPVAALPLFEELLEWVQKGDFPTTTVAASLQAVAYSLSMVANEEADLRRAKVLLESILDICPDEGSMNKLMRSATLVSLAVIDKQEGLPLSRKNVDDALALLIDFIRYEPLEVWRLERIGAHLGLPRWKSRAVLSDQQVRELLLGVSLENVPGRLMRLTSSWQVQVLYKSSTVTCPSWLDGHLTIAELVMGTRIECELGHMVGVLCPAKFVDELTERAGIEASRSFIKETCGEGHPSLALLEQIAALRNR